jgi:hypothetical protein
LLLWTPAGEEAADVPDVFTWAGRLAPTPFAKTWLPLEVNADEIAQSESAIPKAPSRKLITALPLFRLWSSARQQVPDREAGRGLPDGLGASRLRMSFRAMVRELGSSPNSYRHFQARRVSRSGDPLRI